MRRENPWAKEALRLTKFIEEHIVHVNPAGIRSDSKTSKEGKDKDSDEKGRGSTEGSGEEI